MCYIDAVSTLHNYALSLGMSSNDNYIQGLQSVVCSIISNVIEAGNKSCDQESKCILSSLLAKAGLVSVDPETVRIKSLFI
jgi:hypothetical protein